MLSQFMILTISGWLGAIAVILIASLSPELKARPPLVFKYPLRERNAALISAAVFLLVSIALAAFSPNWILSLPEYLNTMDWTLAVLAVLLVMIAFLVLRYRKQPLLSFGWNKKLWRIASRVSLALAFLAVFLSGSISQFLEFLSAESLTRLAILFVSLLAWETSLRGFIQPRFNAWLGEKWGWLAAALLSVALILPTLLTYGMGTDNLIRAIGTQFLLGWIMKRTGHVLPGAVWAAFFAWLLIF
jgi:hypothetical protein